MGRGRCWLPLATYSDAVARLAAALWNDRRLKQLTAHFARLFWETFEVFSRPNTDVPDGEVRDCLEAPQPGTPHKLQGSVCESKLMNACAWLLFSGGDADSGADENHQPCTHGRAVQRRAGRGCAAGRVCLGQRSVGGVSQDPRALLVSVVVRRRHVWLVMRLRETAALVMHVAPVR